MDAITIWSAVLTVFGSYAMFVSSKPVTVGGVLMILVLSVSSTQAVMGGVKVWRSAETVTPEVAQGEKANDQSDMIDVVRGIWSAMR